MKNLLPAILGFILISFSAQGQAVTSVQNGAWNDTNTWDCGCVPDFNSGTITIIHNVTVTADITTDETVISTGGALTINTGVILTLNEDFVTSPLTIDAGRTLTVNGTLDGSGLIFSPINVNGSIVNSGTVSSPDASVMTFASGSSYTHSLVSGGTIPLANWDATSTVTINGMSGANPVAPGNLNQTFGNFTWNCASQGATAGPAVFHLGGLLGTVQGTLTFQSSNNKPIRLNDSGSGYTLTIGVDFVNQACPLILASSLTSATTITVARDFVQTGGNLSFKTTNSNDVRVEVGRNFNKSAGAFAGGTGTGIATLSFNGGVVQTCSIAGTSPATINYEVINNSTVNLGTSLLTGTNLTLASGSTLGVGAVDAAGAIQTGTTAGNIRVSGTRTYSSGSTIVYNGTAAQFMGTGHPSASGVACQVNNSNGVSLASDVTIGGNLTLSSGNLSVLTRTLTLNGNFTPGSNSLVVASTSSLSIGGTGAFGTLKTSGSTILNNFTINRSSSGSVTLGSDLTIAGTLTQTLGDITLNGFTLDISGPYARTNGSINADSNATLIVDGSGALPSAVTFAGGQALNTLTINRASTIFPTSSSLTITNLNLLSGTFNNTGTITMTNGGVLTRTEGSIINNTPTTNPTSNSYDIVYDIASDISTGSEIPAMSNQLRNVTKTGGAQLTLGQSVIINGNLTLTNGIFNSSTFGVTLKGNFVSNTTSILTSGPFTFAGTTVISGSSLAHFNNVTISGSLTPNSSTQFDGNLVNNGTLNAGTGLVTFGGTTTISGANATSFGDVTVTGTLTASSTKTLNIGGDFTNNGTFNHNSGSVTFNGTSSILGSAVTSLFGVTISGALTAPSGTLNIAGDWATTGTFTHNNGKVVLNGTVALQAITGTVAVNDVDVSNAVGVNVNGNVNLYGALTLVSSGTIDADGTSNTGVLTVKSTAVNAGGRIAALPTPGNFSGNVTVERFINSPAGWRYISMPITDGNVALWQASFPVTGNFSNPSPSGANNVQYPTSPSLYYKEMVNGTWVAIGSGASTSATALSNTVGYSAYSYMSGNFTISTRGSIGKGSISLPLGTGGDGYNLVSNPYPSAIDWDNVSLPAQVGTTVYIRIGNNQYASYLKGAGPGTGTNSPGSWWSGEVAAGQSFFVQSTGATSLPLTESAKTSNQYQFLREAAPNNLMRIALSSGDQTDEAIIWFQADATDTTDLNYDAPKMRNGDYFSPLFASSYINLSTYIKSSATDYAINGVAPASCPKSIKIKLQDVSLPDNKLTFSNLSSFNLGYTMSLVDRYLNKSVEISDGFEYAFKVTSDPKSSGDGRFEVQFFPASIVRPVVTVTGSMLTSTQNPGDTFQWLLDGSAIPGATGTKYVASQSGTYTLRVSNGGCSYQSEDVILVVTGVEGLSSNESIRVYPNPVKNILTLELLRNFDEITIYDGIGKQLESIDPKESSSVQIDFSRYQNGVYMLHGTSGAGGFSIKIIKD